MRRNSRGCCRCHNSLLEPHNGLRLVPAVSDTFPVTYRLPTMCIVREVHLRHCSLERKHHLLDAWTEIPFGHTRGVSSPPWESQATVSRLRCIQTVSDAVQSNSSLQHSERRASNAPLVHLQTSSDPCSVLKHRLCFRHPICLGIRPSHEMA